MIGSSRCSTSVLAVVLLAWASTIAPSPALARGACANENAAVSGTAAPDLRASVLCLVNETRAEHGLPALQQDPRLQAAAQQHTDDMVTNQYFAHNSRDGTRPAQRVSAAGYEWAATAENIAQGQGTPRLVVQSWMASTGHCKNILGPGFRDLGVGINPGAASPAASPGTWTLDVGRLKTDSAVSTDATPQAGCPYSLSPVSERPAPAAPPAPPPTADPTPTASPPAAAPADVAAPAAPPPAIHPTPPASPPATAPADGAAPPAGALDASAASPPSLSDSALLPVPLAPPPPVAAVTELRVTPSRFRAASSSGSVQIAAVSARAQVSYSLNVPASVRFTARRRSSGRREAGRCVQTSHTNRQSARCTRYVTVPGSFTRRRGAGADRFTFTGRLAGRALRPGSYRLRAAPTTDGYAGTAQQVGIRIVR